MNTSQQSSLLSLLGLAVLAVTPSLHAEYTYSLTKLGTAQPGWSVIYAYSADDAGVIGYGNLLPNNDVRSWHYAQGTWTELGLLTNGDILSAQAINASGQITGYGTIKAGSVSARAFIYQNGNLSQLGTLGASQYVGADAGGNSSRGNAINDRGQVVGTSTTTTTSHAFIYDNGQMRDLGVLGTDGNSSSEALAINNHGVAVGVSGTEAVVFENGTVRSIGSGKATVINDNGMIAGQNRTRVFVYSEGSLKDITADGWTSAKPTGINNLGQVVGQGTVGINPRCFLYDDGAMKDISTLADFTKDFISPNCGACAIDEQGNIYGFALNKSFINEFFVMKPLVAANPFKALANGNWKEIGPLGWHYGFQNGTGWSYSLNLGFIYSGYHPWLYHPEQGFLYAYSGTMKDGLFLYSASLGVFLWIAESTGSTAYRLDTMAPIDLAPQ
ncbi:MAG: hypothetical protein SFY80_12090 [Verrucomicrobiota bacterium]|nr:hypothetical protein [Verrucomicrobiota bacterium]